VHFSLFCLSGEIMHPCVIACQKPNFFHKRIYKFLPRLDKCINVFRDYVET
jgi:hypothetical protein